MGEPLDPPETCHTPWGIWLHWRDPLHAIDQKYDTEHIIRTTMVAEDILHYAHYVPIIGEHEHKIESYEMGFEYDYLDEEPLPIYDANGVLNEEETEGIDSASDEMHKLDNDLQEDVKVSENRDEDVNFEDDKEENLVIKQKNNLLSKIDKGLMRIIEKIVLSHLR